MLGSVILRQSVLIRSDPIKYWLLQAKLWALQTRTMLTDCLDVCDCLCVSGRVNGLCARGEGGRLPRENVCEMAWVWIYHIPADITGVRGASYF